MSAAEILSELPRLTTLELQRIHERILELEDAQEVEETPELLAAVDEGLRSAETEPVYSIDEVRAKVKEWISKYS
jgi:predicted transcriptional regulator